MGVSCWNRILRRVQWRFERRANRIAAKSGDRTPSPGGEGRGEGGRYLKLTGSLSRITRYVSRPPRSAFCASMIPREILKKIRQIELRTNRLVSETLAGQYHSVFKGQGMNFEEVREYQPGDEVRTIDWNVTARMNHPFVKKFVEERELTLMLVVEV